jgi:hypothetical protein
MHLVRIFTALGEEFLRQLRRTSEQPSPGHVHRMWCGDRWFPGVQPGCGSLRSELEE